MSKNDIGLMNYIIRFNIYGELVLSNSYCMTFLTAIQSVCLELDCFLFFNNAFLDRTLIELVDYSLLADLF